MLFSQLLIKPLLNYIYRMSDNQADICVICQENLSSSPIYELPECSHSYHQKCINAWFRQGNAKCPLCNSCGIGNDISTHPRCGRHWGWAMARFAHIRRAARRKNAPPNLVKGIARIKKREVQLRALKAEVDGWQQKDIILDGEKMKIKDAVSRYKKIATKYRTKSWQLRRAKVAFAQRQNIVPIILVEKRVID